MQPPATATKLPAYLLIQLANKADDYAYSDAFQRRERASEEMAIRKAEAEKLKKLMKKLKEQQAHLQQLSDHM